MIFIRFFAIFPLFSIACPAMTRICPMPSRRRSFVTPLFASLLAALLLSPAAAQERRVPTSLNEVRLSFAPVVQRAAPTVVNVYAAKTVAVQNPLFEDPIFRRFFGAPGGGEQVQRSLGSGV